MESTSQTKTLDELVDAFNKLSLKTEAETLKLVSEERQDHEKEVNLLAKSLESLIVKPTDELSAPTAINCINFLLEKPYTRQALIKQLSEKVANSQTFAMALVSQESFIDSLIELADEGADEAAYGFYALLLLNVTGEGALSKAKSDMFLRLFSFQVKNMKDEGNIFKALNALDNLVGPSKLEAMQVFEETGGLGALENLQNHESEAVYQRAVKLLESKFACEEDFE